MSTACASSVFLLSYRNTILAHLFFLWGYFLNIIILGKHGEKCSQSSHCNLLKANVVNNIISHKKT